MNARTILVRRRLLCKSISHHSALECSGADG
jgi:hypothetical protein